MLEIICSRCGTALENYGTQKIRIGGVGGGWSYAVGNIVEIEQETLPVQIHVCPKCGKIELTATKRTAATLLGRKGFKTCIKCGKRIPLASEECQDCGAEQTEKKE